MLFDWRFKHENFLLQLRQTQLVDEHKRNLNAQNKRKMTSFKITRDPFLAYFECNRIFFLGINQVVKKKKIPVVFFVCVCQIFRFTKKRHFLLLLSISTFAFKN